MGSFQHRTATIVHARIPYILGTIPDVPREDECYIYSGIGDGTRGGVFHGLLPFLNSYTPIIIAVVYMILNGKGSSNWLCYSCFLSFFDQPIVNFCSCLLFRVVSQFNITAN